MKYKRDEYGEEVLDEFGDPIPIRPNYGYVECLYCTCSANWSERKSAFGYWIDAGLSTDNIKRIQPMCLDCTRHYRQMIGLTRNPRRRLYGRYRPSA